MADNRVQIVIDATGGSKAAKEFLEVLNGLNKINKEAKSVSAPIKSLGSDLSSLSSGMKNLFTGFSLAYVTKQFTDLAIQMDKIKTAYASIAGGIVEGAREFEFVRAESDKLGNNLLISAEAYKKLSAAAKGTALEGEPIRKVFTAVSEASTSMKLSADETGRTLYALSQMISKGKVSAEELRQQLGEALPGAVQLAARALGVSTQEIDKMLERGEVLAEDLLPKLAKIMHEQYSGSAAAAANSLSASIEKCKNSFYELGNQIAEGSGFSTALKWMVDQITSANKLLSETPERLSRFFDVFGRTLNIPEATRSANEPLPKQTSMANLRMIEGYDAYLEKQREDLANKKKLNEARAQESWWMKEVSELTKNAISAQEKFVDTVKRLNDALESGAMNKDAYTKSYAKAWEDLLKATQEKTTKPVSSKIDSNLVKLAEWVARYHGISEELFKALIKQESGWDIGAKSPKGAAGLTQIMPGTWSTDIKKMFPWLSNIWDPFQNMFGGAGYLRKILDMVGGNVPLALAGYNAGPYNKYVQAGQIPPYPETQNYVKSIMSSQGVGEELTWMREDQQRKLEEYWESWNKGAQEALDTEVSTMREILQSDTLTQSERVVLQEQYLAKRKEQIQAEAAEIERVTGNKVLAEKWAAEQIKQEQNQLVEHNIQQLQRMLEEEGLTLQRREEIWRQIREKIQAGEISMMDALKLGWKEAINQMNNAAQNMNETGKKLASGLHDALKGTFIALAKGDIKSLADVWERFADVMLDHWAGMLADAIMKWFDFSGSIKGGLGGGGGFGDLFGGLFGWLGKLFGGGGTCPIAHGGVFSGAGIGAYASSVVMRPTLFPFAHGVGLMGESGPEGILPLFRTRDGDLGVKMVGERQPMVVNIHEAPGTKASVEREQDGSLSVMIEQVEQALVSRMHRGSGMSGYLNQKYRRRV